MTALAAVEPVRCKSSNCNLRHEHLSLALHLTVMRLQTLTESPLNGKKAVVKRGFFNRKAKGQGHFISNLNFPQIHVVQ